jgi:hypothetical protein
MLMSKEEFVQARLKGRAIFILLSVSFANNNVPF